MKNFTLDKINNKVTIKYIHDENKIKDLGDNFYRAARRMQTLHEKISKKPELATEMDNYIQD